MSVSIQKSALRKHLLEKRDATSAELRDIVSEKIHENLKKNSSFINAQNIACYFPIGSEVDTHDVMLNILKQGKNLLLPRIVDNNIHFVDEGVDTGPIIVQEKVKIKNDDTEETLSKRILAKEHKAYVKAVKLIAEKKIKVVGRNVKFLS